jgi:two-component system phosphate regulon response regulator PhoB
MKPLQTILVADANPDLVKCIAEQLVQASYHVVTAADGKSALQSAQRYLPSLAILEFAFPDMAGAELLRALKSDAATSEIAVIVISDIKEEVDRIVSFELGADDYITKPLSLRELALRVKSILGRRSVVPGNRLAAVGAIMVDCAGHEVRVGGKRVDITVREFRLLNALLSHPGRVFSREELVNAVWGKDSLIEYRTVDAHVRRLRERLGTAAQQIQTVRGFGYRIEPG